MSQTVATEQAAVAPLMELQAARMRRKRQTQREVLLDVLRIAAQYETWVTLAELAEKTKFPPASISAQLRHLRKEKYGAWKVVRWWWEWVREVLVWEYLLGV